MPYRPSTFPISKSLPTFALKSPRIINLSFGVGTIAVRKASHQPGALERKQRIKSYSIHTGIGYIVS